jgi:hypothetical protein
MGSVEVRTAGKAALLPPLLMGRVDQGEPTGET